MATWERSRQGTGLKGEGAEKQRGDLWAGVLRTQEVGWGEASDGYRQRVQQLDPYDHRYVKVSALFEAGSSGSVWSTAWHGQLKS